MQVRALVRRSAALGLAAAALGVPAAALAAPGETVIASGLNNPRGITFGPGGALYVAEAGTGGPDCLPLAAAGSTSSCWGLTGSITKIGANGQQTRVVQGLPSVAGTPAGAQAAGPGDISFDPQGRAWITIGLGGDPAVRAQAPHGSEYGTLMRLGLGGRLASIADVSAFESANNPIDNVDSNPFSVWAGSRYRYVTDAGGNDLLRVDAGTGNVSLVAAFPDRLVTGPGGSPIPMQAVPTGVTRGPDGAFYLGQLTGFPFLQGSANVYRIVPGQPPQIYAAGFTNITDVAFGDNGSLYVLQGTTAGLAGPPTPGQLIRIRPDGTRTVIADDLVLPLGVAIRGGYAYVTTNGGAPGAGQVVKIALFGH